MKNTFPKAFRLSIVILSLFLFLSGCGEDDSPSSQVTIESVDDSPLVSLEDRTLFLPGHTDENPRTKELTGPWFRTSFQFVNNTEYKLVISSYRAEITAPDGSESTATPDFPDGRFYITEPALEPGESRSPTDIFFFESLPGEVESNSDSFRYRVKIKFIGFFLAADAENDFNPVERFSQTIQFTTE